MKQLFCVGGQGIVRCDYPARQLTRWLDTLEIGPEHLEKWQNEAKHGDYFRLDYTRYLLVLDIPFPGQVIARTGSINEGVNGHALNAKDSGADSSRQQNASPASA